MTDPNGRSKVRRRSFLTSGAFTAAAPLVAESWANVAEAAEPASAAIEPSTSVPMSLAVNGRQRYFAADLRITLLDALREELGLTGTKRAATMANAGPAPSMWMGAVS